MDRDPTRDVLADSTVARGLFALDPQRGAHFVAQRMRVDRLEQASSGDGNEEEDADHRPARIVAAADELYGARRAARAAAAAAADDFYDPVAEDLQRQQQWEAGQAPTVAGGFDDSTYTSDVRTIRALLHSTTLPPTEDVYDACRRGDLPLLRRLVEVQGHDVNQLDRFDASALYYACLCGHHPVVRYLLDHGARCEANSWDAERCHYVALDDSIRKMLVAYSAANRARGPLFSFAYRIVNNPSPTSFADVTFELPADRMAVHAHRALLAARSPYMRAEFAPGGRWAGRRVVVLRDGRLSGVALSAVVSYMYTERLLCPRSALRDVAAVAKNLRLGALCDYLAASGLVGGSGSGGDSLGMVALDLGAPYVVGSLPDGVGVDGSDSAAPAPSSGGDASAADAALAALAFHGVRRAIYRNLLTSAGGSAAPVIPPAAWDLAASLALGGSGGGDSEGDDAAAECADDSDDDADASAPSSPPQPAIPHDLELRVHGVVFRAHRVFLAGRSRYFDSLLRFEEAKGSGGGSSGGSSESDDAHSPPPGCVTVTCDDVTPYTMALVLEWLYADVLRPVPPPLLLEALHAADAFVLGDGLKPLLVGQAVRTLSVDTVVDLFAAADLYNLHRLTAACARFAAAELDAVLALPEFTELIAANAASIVGRHAHADSVPMLDDIKTEVSALFGASVADVVRDAWAGGREGDTGGSGGAGAGARAGGGSRRGELRRRLALLDAFAARLGLKVFSAGQALYSGTVYGSEPGADAVGGSGGAPGAGASAAGGIPLNIPGVGVRLVGGDDIPLTGQLYRALKGVAYFEGQEAAAGAPGGRRLGGGR